MNRPTLPLAILVALSPMTVRAQVGIHIELGLPVAPPLVMIQPGIQVVEGFPEEVFFYRGWYWCRRPDGWYRSHSPRARFDWVEGRRVPGALVRVPAGRYRNWHHEGRPAERGRFEPRPGPRNERHELRGDGHGREGRERNREGRERNREEEHGRH